MNWPSFWIGVGAGIAISGCAAFLFVILAAFLGRDVEIAPIDKLEPRRWERDEHEGAGVGA